MFDISEQQTFTAFFNNFWEENKKRRQCLYYWI